MLRAPVCSGVGPVSDRPPASRSKTGPTLPCNLLAPLNRLHLAAAALGFLVALALRSRAADTPAPAPVPGAAILQELKSFRTLGTVLHIAAHPDDENTLLITYLAKGRNYRTGYLSLTRGDGGQNELGPEFGPLLGLVRTQELLAASKLDGARQFFTRALDFGFSKSVDATLATWDRHEVVGDIVRVIRTFRPDVVITRWPATPSPGMHGHHTASAVLAIEAFKLAGDPKAYPEQLADGITPWQTVRLVQNITNGAVTMAASGSDPVTGESFQNLAARSRSQHKTQGMGSNIGPPRGGDWQEAFNVLAGQPATKDIMEGIDTTWTRVPGGTEVARLADALVDKFKPDDPEASVSAILGLRTLVAKLPADPVVIEKRQQLDHILQECLGLTVETTVPAAEVVPGESLNIHYRIKARSTIPVRLVEQPPYLIVSKSSPSSFVFVGHLGNIPNSQNLTKGTPVYPLDGDLTITLPMGTIISHPYWLQEEPTAGMFRVADPKSIGQPENLPPIRFFYEFEVGGQELIVINEPLGPGAVGQPLRRLAVIAPVSLRFDSVMALFTPGSQKTIEVEVTAARAGETGNLHLEALSGWTIAPANQPFKLAQAGEKTKLAFTVTAPSGAAIAGGTLRDGGVAAPGSTAASGSILAVAEMADGTRYSNQLDEIRYPHIPVQVLQPPARLKVAAFDFAIRGKNVGYLPGAGDDTASSLQQLGYTVTTLTGADLTADKLRGFDAVVLGVRAFNERADLAAGLPALFAYAEQGGTVIAQYNRPNGLKAPQLGPFPLSIQGNAPQLRVTDRNSAVTFLAPSHPALTSPNKITAADFKGWVQERGAYFPSSWDQTHYTALLGMSDPGETQPESSLLIARDGQGWFVYTSLAFFRQLPAAVPGACRLFANLVSMGK